MNAICDVVILSNSKTDELVCMTNNAIRSLIESEDPGTFNIHVIEQTDHNFDQVNTIHIKDEFNYNRFANHGVRQGSCKWICVANNDLIFTPGWFSKMMKYKYDVMSPLNPLNKRQRTITGNEGGYINGVHFSGWCFVMRRSIWEAIGGFDEDFPFWCADNATVSQLHVYGSLPILIPESEVLHLISTTLKTVDAKKRKELTFDQVIKYNQKYSQNIFGFGK